MNTQVALIIAIGIASAALFGGGIYSVVPTGAGGETRAVAVFIVNRFTGSAVFCNGSQCSNASIE